MKTDAECKYLAKSFTFSAPMKDGVYFYCDVYEREMDTTQCLRCYAKKAKLLKKGAKGSKKLEDWLE